ncbi:MAG: hypothetical protein LBD24_09110 [Spirochaetaceae bacterium]|nr:hypothetical protein [Spirochaetaceae bacterium]
MVRFVAVQPPQPPASLRLFQKLPANRGKAVVDSFEARIRKLLKQPEAVKPSETARSIAAPG